MMDYKQIRLTLGLTQAQMAKALNTHKMMVYRWEKGERKPKGQAQRLYELLLDMKDKNTFEVYREKYINH